LKIHIIDYDAGNIESIRNALRKIGCEPVTTNNPKDLFKAKAIIFPGQGSFPAAMKKLNKNGIDKALIELINNKMPFIGICLGLQLMFTKSEEGECKGLDLFKGTVPKIPDSVKVPHIGWNNVSFNNNHPIFNGIPDNSYFYFIHSYYVNPDNLDNIIAQTNYGLEFCSAYAYENYVGLQFHPERSGDYGLKIYQNFINKLI
jgi:glutamine amidotransferase